MFDDYLGGHSYSTHNDLDSNHQEHELQDHFLKRFPIDSRTHTTCLVALEHSKMNHPTDQAAAIPGIHDLQ